MNHEQNSMPHNFLVGDGSLEAIQDIKRLTDDEARMAMIDPGSVFKGFKRVKEIDEHPIYHPRDNWERHVRKRSGRLIGRTEVNGKEFSTTVLIHEPNIAIRGIMHLLGKHKVATAYIERSTRSVSANRKLAF